MDVVRDHITTGLPRYGSMPPACSILRRLRVLSRNPARLSVVPCPGRSWGTWLHVAKASAASIDVQSHGIEKSIRSAGAAKIVRSLRRNLLSAEEVAFQGTGRHLGVDVVWQLRCREDGAFMEEIRGRHVSWRWGYSGGASGVCWEVDDAGVPKRLQLDDQETCLLSTWVRSGFWVREGATQVLQMRTVTEKEVLASPLTHAEPSRSASPAYLPDSEPSSSGHGGTHDAHGATVVEIQLTSGKLTAQVHVCTDTWTVVGVVQDVCGDVEAWQLIDWTPWHNSTTGELPSTLPASAETLPDSTLHGRYPRQVVHFAAAGGEHHYRTTTAQLVAPEAATPLEFNPRLPLPAWTPWPVKQALLQHITLLPFKVAQEEPRAVPPAREGDDNGAGEVVCDVQREVQRDVQRDVQHDVYSMPHPPLLPDDTVFDTEVCCEVPACLTPSGHIIVKPFINGQQVGFMILDTGASGLVLERSVADRLGLEGFGELFVLGMAGKVQSQFRRGETLSLGPLSMRRPLFMEMQLSGIVSGAPGPVVGIIGYDIFRRAVVEMPHTPVPASTVGISPCVVRLHNPEHYDGTHLPWQELQMIANLPYVLGDFQRGSSADAQEVTCSALFMLDTGAGGVDVIFQTPAVQDLKLVDQPGVPQRMRKIKGVGGQAGIQAKTGDMEWLRLSGVQFDNVRCLLPQAGGVQLSVYTAGIICSDLMRRCTVLVDLPRNRVAFVQPQAERQAGADATRSGVVSNNV